MATGGSGKGCFLELIERAWTNGSVLGKVESSGFGPTLTPSYQCSNLMGGDSGSGGFHVDGRVVVGPAIDGAECRIPYMTQPLV